MDRDFAIRTMPLGYDLLDHIIRLSFTFSTGAVQGCSCRLSSRSLSLYLPFSLLRMLDDGENDIDVRFEIVE